MIAEQQEIVRRVEGLVALADRLEARLGTARSRVGGITPSFPPSPGYGGTGLARAWTHSLPARSRCALMLRRILFPRSQRVQIARQFLPQDPTDEPAAELLERNKESVRPETKATHTTMKSRS